MTQELLSTWGTFGTPARASGPSGIARPVWKSSAAIEKEDDMTGEPIHSARSFARTWTCSG